MQLIQRCRLVRSPQRDRAQFAFLVREFVSCFYPGTEPTYGLNLFNEHIAGFQHGENARRNVWAIRDGSQSVGFLTATRRPGGAVKVGPIVVEPGHRAAGYMLDAVEQLTASYCAAGVPYLYATFPRSNASIQRLASSAGWTVSGAVRGLYRDDEEILIHRATPALASLACLPAGTDAATPGIRFAGKRGGSVLLRAAAAAPHDIELAGRNAGKAVRAANRICFSRVDDGLAATLDSDERVRLVDGTTLVIWR